MNYKKLLIIIGIFIVTISEILKSAKKKFGFEFNERLFFEQLSYFQDIETTKISFIKKEVPDSEIKRFLIQMVKRSVPRIT